jgi:WS/DGAT/MGAT family acyltransferase
MSAPKTMLNRSVGPHRVFDAAEFPLEGFKDIKDAAGVTVNDVALAVVGGALRRYLDSHGETPEGSLAAGIPLNMRTRRGVTDDNNQVGSVFSSLHTDIKDPIERLRAVHESANLAKQDGEVSPMVDMLRLAGAVSPVVAKTVAGIWSRNELSRHIPLNISTVITNVPGPNFPLYCAGARMVDYYGLGVLTPGMGIFHAVFSYAGKITLSVLADRDIMPDPQNYHDLLVAAYEELYAAASKLGKPRRKASKSAVAAKAKIASPKRKQAGAKPKSAGTGTRKKPAAKKAASTTKKTTKAKSASKPRKASTAKPKAAARPRRKSAPQLKVVPKLKAS